MALTSMNVLFPTTFFLKYKIPNFVELLELHESYVTKESNTDFEWNFYCNVKTSNIPVEEALPVIKPSLDLLSKDIGSFNFTMFDPWVNTYGKGSYQEVHDHSENDIAAVFFLNQGDNFGEFYIKDRMSPLLSARMKKQLNYMDCVRSSDVNIQKGEVIFFPGHVLHGVTPHLSDVDRKTIAANINIVSG